MNRTSSFYIFLTGTGIVFLSVIFFLQCSTVHRFNVPGEQPGRPEQVVTHVRSAGPAVKPGIDVLLEKNSSEFTGKRIGLITNQSGVNRNLEQTVDLLYRNESFTLTALFAPEHGIRGDIPAGQPVAHYTDPRTELPIYSLYGSTRKPLPEMLENVDVLFFDIQDVGVRPYTYVSTMAYAMEAAEEAGIEFVVLDRPNPLGGEIVEGSVLDPDFASFIGLYPIPYVHGMTVGELAWLFNREFGIGADLRIIPMEGWQRSMPFSETGLAWIPTSPHIPNAETPVFYATTGCIGELGTLSVGVGFTLPFRLVGAPWIDAYNLAQQLNGRNLPGVMFRPTFWQQMYGIFEGQHLGGVELYITNQDTYRPFATGVNILDAINTLYPDRDIFSDEHSVSFNRAVGTDTIFSRLKAGVPADVIIASYQKDLEAFRRIRQEYLLY